jgi:hypothetical protein
MFKKSVAEPHHLYAAPAPSENFDAAPAAPAAPAIILLYGKQKMLKGIKVNLRSDILFLLILCNDKIKYINFRR